MPIPPHKWKFLKRKYAIGEIAEVRITNIFDYRVYVQGVNDGMVGYINSSELKWNKYPQTASDIGGLVSIGDIISAKVIGVQNKKQRVIFSSRMVDFDPWLTNIGHYQVGKSYPVKVVDVDSTKCTVLLEDGIVGFIGSDEIPQPKELHEIQKDELKLDGVLLPADITIARILEIDRTKREILFGINSQFGQYSLPLTFSDVARVKVVSLDPEVEIFHKKRSEWKCLAEIARNDRGIKTILIVDDDRDYLTSSKILMADLGFDDERVLIAHDVKTAKQLIKNYELDLFLVDINLGINEPLSGLDLLKYYCERPVRGLVVPVSAMDQNYLLLKRRDLLKHIDGFLQKPFMPEDLLNIIIGNSFTNKYEGNGDINFERKPFRWELDSTLTKNSDALKTIQLELNALISESGGVALIAKVERESKQVFFTAANGISKGEFEKVSGHLWKSPIRDVIIDRQKVFDNSVHIHKERYHYLIQIFEGGFNSFIGLPVEVLGDYQYGLFLFHPESAKYHSQDMYSAQRCVDNVSLALSKDAINEVFRREQKSFLDGRFTKALVHNLRHILATIYNESSALITEVTPNKSVSASGGDANQCDAVLKRMANLTRQFRQIEQSVNFFLETKEDDVPIKDDLNRRIEDMFQVLKPTFTEENIIVDRNYDNNIGRFRLYFRLLDQVILNVIFNAYEQILLERDKFGAFKGEKGRVKIETHLVSTDVGQVIRITIEDNGPGIHYSHFDKVFSGSFSTRKKGAGYGLYLSKQIMNRLGGTITIHSSMIFHGSTFFVEVPINTKEVIND